MEEMFSRSSLIYGKEAIEVLHKSHVAIFGIGGVGGYVVESLARTGVGEFTLIDNDVISVSNINRQIIATSENVGQYKVDEMKKRILSLNPNCKVNVYKTFVLDDTIESINLSGVNYIVDAIDTVKGKLVIIKRANELNIPMISSMGAGNKVNSMGFIVADINKTEVDPLAKVIRKELRALGIKKLKVVYSKESPMKPTESLSSDGKREIPGSNAFVPSACGLLIASEVVRDLTNEVAREELKR